MKWRTKDERDSCINGFFALIGGGDMARFDSIFNHIVDLEGAYSNHSADSGGKTKFGITEATARRNGYEGDMRELPKDKARSIYYNEYWKEPRFCDIKEYSIAKELFEQGVNLGTTQATKNFQKSINIVCDRSLVVDGIIGPRTLNAYNNCNRKNNIYVMLNVLQARRYLEIVENNPSQKVFLNGWLKRVTLTKR